MSCLKGYRSLAGKTFRRLSLMLYLCRLWIKRNSIAEIF